MKIVAFLVSGTLLLSALQLGCASAAAQSDTPLAADAVPPSSAGATPASQLSPDELNQLVAPIALYPDPLVAQILAGASFPTEVVEAQRWMNQQSGLKGAALAQAVDQQPWDPSVKALTQFPSVLAMMDSNLSWTSALGDAYVNEPQTVLNEVQVMRHRAQQAGNLQSTPQENVADEGQTIAIEPASPDVVYVPEYDPWSAYGTPLAYYPDWDEPEGFYGPGIYFGLGIGLFGGFGWGWHHWGTDWHGHGLTFDHHDYHPHSPTFDRHGHFDGHGGFDHGQAFGHEGIAHAGLGHPGIGGADFNHGGAVHGGFGGGAPLGTHSGAFSGFNHGGVTNSFSSRGQASFHAGGGGGFHGGGGGGGGFHGGGGGHR